MLETVSAHVSSDAFYRLEKKKSDICVVSSVELNWNRNATKSHQCLKMPHQQQSQLTHQVSYVLQPMKNLFSKDSVVVCLFEVFICLLRVMSRNLHCCQALC